MRCVVHEVVACVHSYTFEVVLLLVASCGLSALERFDVVVLVRPTHHMHQHHTTSQVNSIHPQSHTQTHVRTC